MKHEAIKKTLAFTVCIIFILVTLLSVTFVLTHTHHEHDHAGPGGNCATCIHLTVAGNVLKLITGVFVCTAFGSDGFSAICSAIKAVRFRTAFFTLVHQKIKLNI